MIESDIRFKNIKNFGYTDTEYPDNYESNRIK